MPQFLPGESKTAIAPIMVKPAGLDSEAELFLGPDELTKVATSGLVPFVSTGLGQAVRLPVTMPDVEGNYHVYIDVHAQDILVGAFQAIEDVVITAPLAGIIDPGYIWHEPLVGWETLVSGREIPLNEEIHLAPGWMNESEIAIIGHVNLAVTYPDGTKAFLSAVLNQDKEAAPHNGWHVQFEPFISSQEGTYTLEATLSSGGQVLDSVTFSLVAVAPALPFNMYISKIDTTINKYATAYWLMEVTCQISNPHGYPITHKLYCCWAFGSRNPNDPASFRYDRHMGRYTWPDTFLSVTLNPGQSVTLVSPFYYWDGWHDTHRTYEWTNMPPGMYSAGVRKKYYFRIIDELGNWSPYKSVGTA